MRFPRIGRIAAMMVLAFVVASCEHGGTPTDITSSEYAGEPQQLLGLDALLSGSTTVTAVDQYGQVRKFELLREPLLSLNPGDLTLSKLIGIHGGTISLLGHSIVVPAGAVDLPTLFTLSVLSTGYVQVDISALAPGMSGLVDVGEEGFNRPVRLVMTYERATNVKREDRLVILRLNPAGMDEVHEALPTTVSASADKASAWLEHFSGYIMAQ